VVFAVVCALLSSLAYALASVLQHRAAIAQPVGKSMRIGLLTKLVRSRLWLLGIGFDGVAFALQFLALGHSSLVLVQPLLVCGLLFALPIGAWSAGSRMTPRDWYGATAVVVGLALFLVVSSPGKGHAEVANQDWVILFAVTGTVIAGLLVAARGRSGRIRAGLLAAAAGINYGVTAALTKAAAALLGNGLVELFESWEVYVLVGAGLFGMLLAQSAFQAGPLDSSLPVLTVADPIVSILIGALVLGEGVQSGPVSTSLECIGLVLVTLGVVALSQAEAVKGVLEESPGV
jgi:drug/metabolite transporter (DMT)-like permease